MKQLFPDMIQHDIAISERRDTHKMTTALALVLTLHQPKSSQLWQETKPDQTKEILCVKYSEIKFEAVEAPKICGVEHEKEGNYIWWW